MIHKSEIVGAIGGFLITLGLEGAMILHNGVEKLQVEPSLGYLAFAMVGVAIIGAGVGVNVVRIASRDFLRNQ